MWQPGPGHVGGVVVLLLACNALRITLANPSGQRTSNSPTLSVQRFGGSTFYNYVKSMPTTEASFLSAIEIRRMRYNDTEAQTSLPAELETSKPGSSGSDSSDSGGDDDVENESEENLVSGGKEEDAQTTGNSPKPTVIPIVLVTGESEASVTAEHEQDKENGDVNPSKPNDNGGTSPDDQNQTPPPAEAVPGQPVEDGENSSSSSSSSEESSSSSSEEEYRQAAYKFRKFWPLSKQKVDRF